MSARPHKSPARPGSLRFILRMAWRDSRASRRRLVLFSLSIVLGVAALVAIGSVGENLRTAIDKEARGLLGADLEVSWRSKPSPEALAFLDGLGGTRTGELSFPSMIVFPTAGGQTRLVTLRGVEQAYPFYGNFRTEPPEAAAQVSAGEAVVVLENTLLSQFGLKPGDPVKLGTGTFRIAGGLLKIPGDAAGLTAMSPRVILPMNQLETAGLMGTGSLVRHRAFFKFPDGFNVDARVRESKEKIQELKLSTDTVAERKKGLGKAVESVDAFLSLVGFIALFLGAIGVASAMHVYIRQKLITVAVLRCLGASSWQGFAVYLVQGLGIGIAGAALGTALGVALQQALPLIAQPWLPFEVDFAVAWRQVAQGFAAGVVICVLFTLLPLLSVRRVTPLSALRSSLGEGAGGPDPLRWLVWLAIGAAVTGFAIQQTPRWQVGVGFVVALLLAFSVLTALAKVTAWAARKFFPARAPYVWRQGVANLHRPQNRTVLLLLSLGLGTFLIVTMALTRATLLAQITGSGSGERPNLLFFDVQNDQVEPLKSILEKEHSPLLAAAPIVTMKLSRYKDRPIAEVSKDNTLPIPRWTLQREYRCTFRSTLTSTEKLIAGTFTGKVEPGTEVVPVSLEQSLAKDMQLSLGDTLEFDVQGVPMKAKVTSLREVEWRRMEPNFFILFPEGVLEGAPNFYIAATRAGTPGDSARIQQAVVAALPNVSAIDLGLVLETLDGIFSKVQLVVQLMALFTVFTGVIVLAGAVMGGRYQRLRETVLLRTLGASRRQLVRIQLVEYSILGLLGAAVGCALAIAANAALAHWVFKTEPVLEPVTLVLAVLAVTAITLFTGWFANRSITDHPPLEILREET
jgi:putative ABC transport system permease protein